HQRTIELACALQQTTHELPSVTGLDNRIGKYGHVAADGTIEREALVRTKENRFVAVENTQNACSGAALPERTESPVESLLGRRSKSVRSAYDGIDRHKHTHQCENSQRAEKPGALCTESEGHPRRLGKPQPWVGVQSDSGKNCDGQQHRAEYAPRSACRPAPGE